MKNKYTALFLTVLLLFILSACSNKTIQTSDKENTGTVQTASETTAAGRAPETVDIQILATSDIHTKFYPWDYSLDAESASGSMPQMASAIAEKRNENTLVLDAGDLVQNIRSELSISLSQHPVAVSMNYIGYDAWTTGNHEYNDGPDTLKSLIGQINTPLLLSNVLDAEGTPLGQPYAVFERGGVRIGVIGVVTPNITYWDAINLKGCTVADPVETCRKAIAELEGKADILIALAHMDLENELGTPNSGAIDLAAGCPEFDVIIAAHGHKAIDGKLLGNVLCVENKDLAQTMAEIHLTVEKTAEGCRLIEKRSGIVTIADYPGDEILAGKLKTAHEMALENSHKVIGVLEGGNLAPENELLNVPQAQLQDTALLDLINNVMMHYADTKVSAVALTSLSAAPAQGPIRLCDVSRIYKYSNTLYRLSMTGAQLKKYMEWSAQYYQQYQNGDLTVAFDPKIRFYNYDCFAGVNYEINLSKPVGERIENLTWPDGTQVKDEDVFPIAVTNYRAETLLLTPGALYEADDLPALLEDGIHSSDIGGLRDLVTDYIKNVRGGKIFPLVDHNWKLTGISWDPALHAKAVEQVNAGILSVNTGDDSRTVNGKKITVTDLNP